MKICIVNYSVGHWYSRGAERLNQSLQKVGFKGACLWFNNFNSEGCLMHEVSPYAFKYWALVQAREFGFDCALWLDSSFWAIKSLDALFEEINSVGYVLQESDFLLGEWCSDNALRTMQVDREDAMKISMYDGGFLGLKLTDSKSTVFLDKMVELSKDGLSFQGAWTNEKQQVSKDLRVKGHRHDMSVGTMLAHTMELKTVPQGKYWCPKFAHDRFKDVCLLGEGM